MNGIEYTFLESMFSTKNFDEPAISKVRAVLRVGVPLLQRFSDDVQEEIREALEEVAFADRDYVAEVLVTPVAGDGDWRERVAGSLGVGPVNQATLARLTDPHPQEDRLHFRDVAELSLYWALKRAQERYATDPAGTLAILPNAAVRVRGKTWEVDFLVVFRGRSGVIEVDGASHQRKYASDRSRDRLLEDAGIRRIDRIDVADAEREQEADAFVERHLQRLVAG